MGYLEEYTAKESDRAQRTERLKRGLTLVIATLAVAGVLFYWLKNYKQEKRAEEFLTVLEHGDYPAAYRYWGCRVEAPCPNYNYQSFLEDWGPASAIGKLQSHRLVGSHERGSGVVIGVALNNRPEVKLWVEKSTGVLGFAPPF
jgi:hypothetical protein